MSSRDDVSLKVTMVSPETGRITTKVEHHRVNISLSELIEDTRPPPLSSEDFHNFLTRRYAEESFLFLKAISKYHKQVNDTSAAEEDSEEMLAREQAATWDLARSIYNLFIEPDSEFQVNLSFSVVDNIKEDIDNKTNMRFLLDDAEREIEALILSQGLVHQFISENVQNINSAEKSRRRKVGFGVYALGLAYLCILEFAVSISPWYRLFAAIFFTYGTTQILSAQMGICVFLAKRKRKMTDDGKFSYIAPPDGFSRVLEGMFVVCMCMYVYLSLSLSLSLSRSLALSTS